MFVFDLPIVIHTKEEETSLAMIEFKIVILISWYLISGLRKKRL